MSPGSLQELAEPGESVARQGGLQQDEILALSCNIASCKHFPAVDRPGVNYFAPVETVLLRWQVLGCEDAAERPPGHYVAVDHLAKQTVLHAAGKIIVEQGGLGCGQGKLAEKGIARKRGTTGGVLGCLVATKHGKPHLNSLAALSEALRAIKVGHACFLQFLEDGRQARQCLGIRTADQDAKAIAAQVARSQLVAMPADAEHAHAVAVK